MSELRINRLLKKYKYDFMLCESCGGRVIRDKELVCSICGLVQDKILVPPANKTSVYKNNTEGEYRKTRRESEFSKKLNKLDRNKKRFTSVRITRESSERLSEYCKINKYIKYKFLTEIIEKAITK